MTLERKGTGKHSHKESQQSYEENKKNEVLRSSHPHSRGSDVAGSVGKCRWLIEFKYNTKCIFHDAAL